MSQSLATLDRAARMLAEIRTVDDAKAVVDMAEAARYYAKKVLRSAEAQNAAAEVKVKAQRRGGEILREMEKRDGGDAMRARLQAATELPPTLADIGVSKSDSSRWQKLAALPAERFEEMVEECRTSGAEITTAYFLRAWRREKKNSKPSPEISALAVRELGELVASGRKWSTIYADPPWLYGNQGTRGATGDHYGGMTAAEVAALPIRGLAADNAHLHLWTTNAFLFDAREVIEAWGFTYKSCFVWVKPQMGMGNYWRVSHEFCLFGVRGTAPFGSRSEMSWREWPRGQHSAKPERMYELIEKVSPGPYVELFARRRREGWSAWGNQIGTDLFFQEAV